MYVVIQTAYKPFYAALLLSDIQQIHVHVHCPICQGGLVAHCWPRHQWLQVQGFILPGFYCHVLYVCVCVCVCVQAILSLGERQKMEMEGKEKLLTAMMERGLAVTAVVRIQHKPQS